jgi:uncharacterized membrane protein
MFTRKGNLLLLLSLTLVNDSQSSLPLVASSSLKAETTNHAFCGFYAPACFALHAHACFSLANRSLLHFFLVVLNVMLVQIFFLSYPWYEGL